MAQMKELCTNFKRWSMKQEEEQRSQNWCNHSQNGWRLTPMKSCENEFLIIFRTSTIIECSRVSHMNSDTSWIGVNNCAKRKRTSIMGVPNLPSLPWNITSLVHKIRKTLKRKSNLPACIGKPLPPRCGLNPASSKSSNGSSEGSSNPMSIHPRTMSHYINRKILREDRIWATIHGCQTCRKHSFETLIFKYVYLDTMMNRKEKNWEQPIGMFYFQYWEQNSKINWKENSRMRIGSSNFAAEASKQGLKSVKDRELNNVRAIRRHSGEMIISLMLMNYVKIPCKSTIHLSRGSSTKSKLCCRRWIGGRRKDHEERRQTFSSQLLICLNDDAIEAKVVTDVKKLRKVNHQIHSRPEQNAKHWIHLSATQERILADRV